MRKVTSFAVAVTALTMAVGVALAAGNETKGRFYYKKTCKPCHTKGAEGGEVTPLFFIGAALGNVLGRALGLPLELSAGVGMAAVFAAASNTPLALSIMAMELLGASAFPHVVIVCVLAYLLTGHRSIYPSQRIVRRKGGVELPRAVRVREHRDES